MELVGVHDGRFFRVAIEPKTNGFALCDRLVHVLGLDVRPCKLCVLSLVQKDGNFPLELYAPICEGAEIRYSSALVPAFASASPANGRAHIRVVVDADTKKRTNSSISSSSNGNDDSTPQSKQTPSTVAHSSIEERSPKRLCGERATIESIYIPITKRYTQATEPLPLSAVKMILSQLKVKTRVYSIPMRTTMTMGRAHSQFSKTSTFVHVETIISHVVALVDSDEDDGQSEGKALAVDIRGALVEPEMATSFQADLLIWKGARRLVVVCLTDSLEQGREECLVLMEVALALNNKTHQSNSSREPGSQTMFGIVTDHTNWLFLKRTADMLEKETVSIESNVMHQAIGSGVERVAGRIHHILKHS